MVSKNQKEVNFEKLEDELQAAREADDRYTRENDAKFRAVYQKVGSYEEFRDIVLASHLKPLDKTDKITDSSFKQQWNVMATDGNAGKDKSTKSNEQLQRDQLPTTGHEFAKVWTRRCKTQLDRYRLLLQIQASSSRKVIYSEICSGGHLGDVTSALSDEYGDEDAENVFALLEDLSCVEKFRLSLVFLTDVDKEKCSKLFDRLYEKLRTSDGGGGGAMDDLREKIDTVKIRYEIK